MKRFHSILVVVEEESHCDAAVARATWLAKANGARLTFVDVAPEEGGGLARILAALPGERGKSLGEGILAAHHERVGAFAAAARAKGLDARGTVVSGTPFIGIIREVLLRGHDLIIKGQHTGASGLAGGYRGPDLHLIRKAPCPVWIVREDEGEGARRILACVDPEAGDDDPTRAALNRTVLELALSMAERDGASVDILGVWRVAEEHMMRSGRIAMTAEEADTIVERERNESLSRLQRMIAGFTDGPVRTNVLHLKGVPGDVIPDHANTAGIDTIVMGTVGRTGIAGLFIGNTAETILGRVGCSVVAVKPPGFVSPVTAGEATG